jgi:hypothetical protein
MISLGYFPHSRFSPKRFKRFPRFTIFLNRDESCEYIRENTISLSPEFLNYLMNPESARIANNEIEDALNVIRGENLKTFDPFDKVVLARGIDNSILTSYRTLKKENNIISDTLKIIHNKFLPVALKSQFMNFYKQRHPHPDKMFYPHSDSEVGSGSSLAMQNVYGSS